MDKKTSPGDLHPELLGILAGEIAKLASQFQSIAVRAMDFSEERLARQRTYLRVSGSPFWSLVEGFGAVRGGASPTT